MQFDLFTKPAPAPEKPAAHSLRWYQEEAVAAIKASLSQHQSTLCVMATGLGKTVLFSSIAHGWAGRVLVIAHREELISQARETLERATGERVGTEKAEYRAGNERLVVASIQTMHRRLESFSPDHWSLIIIDEAHRSTAATYVKVLKYFTSAKVLGVTATPDRSDEKALGKVFDDVAYVMDIEDGIDAGYLVPIRGKEVFVEEVDLSNVATVNGDLAQGELDEEMVKGTESVVQKTYELSGSSQVIVFTPGVKSAHAMCERMNAIAPGKAIAIDGETESTERRALVAGFKRGQYQFLFNCAVATEGFDAPATSVVAIARPTKSRQLYAQMCGRGTRVLPGVVDGIKGKDAAEARRGAIAASVKPWATILDFVGNSGKHSLVGPVDILGGNYNEEEVKLAKEKVAKEKAAGETADVHKALKDARAELRALAAKMQAAKAKVKAQVTEFDPFKLAGMRRDSEEYLSMRFGSQPMSEKQRETLLRFGVKEADVNSMDRRAASKMLSQLMKRIDEGRASLKQLSAIAKYYPVSDKISFETAHRAMDHIARSRWRPDPSVLRSILEGGAK